MALAHESACGGFPECLYGGAVVSVSVGDSTAFPGAQARGQIAPRRLQTDQRLLNAMALYLIVAWRIHSSTMAGRAYPDVPCDVMFEPREWHTIYTMQ
jgi:hypothetical protein